MDHFTMTVEYSMNGTNTETYHLVMERAADGNIESRYYLSESTLQFKNSFMGLLGNILQKEQVQLNNQLNNTRSRI